MVAESFEYFGLVQEKLMIALFVSASVGVTAEAELLKTGETPN